MCIRDSYVGAWITWITFGLVALLQANTPFGLLPGVYMLIVLGVSMFFNTIIDNIVRTTVMAENLKVHPALVLVGALIGVQLFGFIGIIIAAPVMASLALLLHYVINKLNDQNPWEDYELQQAKKKSKIAIFLQTTWEKFINWIAPKFHQLRDRFTDKDAEHNTPVSDPDTSINEE